MLILVGLDLLPLDMKRSEILDILEALPASISCGICDSLLRVPSVVKEHWALAPMSLALAAQGVESPQKVDVIGYDEQLAKLDLHVVQRLLNPKMFQDMGFKQFPKVVLVGPSGVGKTHLLEHCLSLLSHKPFYVHPKDLLGRYVGEGEQSLA